MCITKHVFRAAAPFSAPFRCRVFRRPTNSDTHYSQEHTHILACIHFAITHTHEQVNGIVYIEPSHPAFDANFRVRSGKLHSRRRAGEGRFSSTQPPTLRVVSGRGPAPHRPRSVTRRSDCARARERRDGTRTHTHTFSLYTSSIDDENGQTQQPICHWGNPEDLCTTHMLVVHIRCAHT